MRLKGFQYQALISRWGAEEDELLERGVGGELHGEGGEEGGGEGGESGAQGGRIEGTRAEDEPGEEDDGGELDLDGESKHGEGGAGAAGLQEPEGEEGGEVLEGSNWPSCETHQMERGESQ